MTQVTKDQIRDALNTLEHWRECRRNFSTTQNRTEYDQAALDVCTGHAETIRTILQSALDAGGDAWQPIETAPRDGTTIFGRDNKNGHRGLVSFNGREWECVHPLTNTPMGIGFYPTHWQNEPETPAFTQPSTTGAGE